MSGSMALPYTVKATTTCDVCSLLMSVAPETSNYLADAGPQDLGMLVSEGHAATGDQVGPSDLTCHLGPW